MYSATVMSLEALVPLYVLLDRESSRSCTPTHAHTDINTNTKPYHSIATVDMMFYDV